MDTTSIVDGRELLERLRQCVAHDRRTTARLLVQMAEVDARGLYRDEGFSSMFDYCVRALHMSESETSLRIRVARFGRTYPEAIRMLARGELHLSAIGLLSPVMTAERTELLHEVAFKSKREVEEILAKYFPQPDVPTRIRKLPEANAATSKLEQRSLGSVLGGTHTISGSSAAAMGDSEVSVAPASTAAAVRGGLGATSGVEPIGDGAGAGGCFDRVRAGRDGNEGKRGDEEILDATLRGAVGDGEYLGAVVHRAVDEGERLAAARESAGDNGFGDSVIGCARADHDVASPALTATPVPARAKQRPAPAPVPLGKGRYKVQFTASQRLCDKFAQAQHLLRHQVADGDLALILERALDLLIAERRKKLFAQSSRPRDRQVGSAEPTPGAPAMSTVGKSLALATSPSSTIPTSEVARDKSTTAHAPARAATVVMPAAARSATTRVTAPASTVVLPQGARSSTAEAATSISKLAATPHSAVVENQSRHIPSSVKRGVVARDGERCSFVAPDGRRCEERGWLQLHHDRPFARRGPATIDNIRILCRSHNMLMAERDFGRGFMVAAATSRQRPDAAPQSGQGHPRPGRPVRKR